MNRREFIERAVTSCSSALVLGLSITKVLMPKKWLRAKSLANYPGRLKPLDNINLMSKWSG